MKDPILQSLTLLGYRSFVKEKVAFANPTFLVGRNGAGKSNLRHALEFLSEAMSVRLDGVIEQRGGIDHVLHRGSRKSSFGLAVVIGAVEGQIAGANYSFKVKSHKSNGFEVERENCKISLLDGSSVWFSREGKTFNSNVQGLKPSLEPVSLGLPLIGGAPGFSAVLRTLSGIRCYSIEPAWLRTRQDLGLSAPLQADGSNVARALEEIGRESPDDLARIGELLAAIIPNTTSVRSVKRRNTLTLEFTQEWGGSKPVKFDSLSMSDGTLRAVGLLAAVYQRPAPSVLLIEEPEATIHPGALGAIQDLLRHASRFMQVIVTTHSPEMLDAEWIGDENFRIVTWEDGATHVLPLSAGTREALQEHLMSAGELLRSNALRPANITPGNDRDLDALEDLGS